MHCNAELNISFLYTVESIYQTAEFGNALRTIAIVMLVIYGLRILGRILGPWLAKKASERMKKLAEDQMRKRGFTNGAQSQKPEGTVTVENLKSQSRKPSSQSDGEVVDYEIVE